jgi:hypothetical protein
MKGDTINSIGVLCSISWLLGAGIADAATNKVHARNLAGVTKSYSPHTQRTVGRTNPISPSALVGLGGVSPNGVNRGGKLVVIGGLDRRNVTSTIDGVGINRKR